MKNICRTILIAVFLHISLGMQAGESRHLFQKVWEAIDTSTVRTGNWCPYPDYRDRAGWDAFTGEFKNALIAKGEKYLNFQWKIIKATDYLAFERTGDRNSMADPNNENKAALSALALAELAEGKGRFLDQLINGVWFQTERTSWVLSAHEYRKASGRALPDYRDIILDLGSQITGHQIALILYFFKDEFDKVDPSITAAVQNALKEKIFDPYLDKSKWKSQSWIGFPTESDGTVYYWENWNPVNNWNVWCNSVVSEISILAQPDRKILMECLGLAARSIDKYLDYVDMDGGCDEGPSYWGHAVGCLYWYLRYMNDVTGGKFGCWDDPQIEAKAKYISRVNMGDGWMANFGDGIARATGTASLTYRFGKDAGIKELSDYAVYLDSYKQNAGTMELSSDIATELENLRYASSYKKDMAAANAAFGGDVNALRQGMRSNLPPVTWYKGTQHIIMRHPSGLTLAAKGGHNEESHNHNDVGTIILSADEMPVLLDVGPTTYMRQTFNKKERYTIWSMRSEWHNVPVINGKPQHDGIGYAASTASATPKSYIFTTEISGAYEQEAACRKWTRTVQLADRTLKIADKYELEKRIAPDEEHFMVRGEVKKIRDGVLSISYRSFDGKRSGTATLSYPSSMEVAVESKPLDDFNHSRIWGSELKRIVLKSAANAPVKGKYTISVKF